MNKILTIISGALVNRPVTCAAIILALVLGFGTGLSRLEMDSSANGLIQTDDPETLAYGDIKSTFGDDVAVSIIYRSDVLFSPEVLASIDDVTFALEDLDGVTRVVSLATASDLRGEGDDLNTSPLMSYPPETQEEADVIRDHALANELLVGEVVGRDGKAAALSAFVEARPQDPQFERRTLAAIEDILTEQRARLGSTTTIYVSGAPVVSVAIVDQLLADGILLAPLSMLAVGLMLLVFFRASIVVIVPVVTGVASVTVTLGFMGLVGFEINPMSIIIPSLLLVVGATEDIHLLSEYAVCLGRDKDKKSAIAAMLRISATAIILTSVTTTVGFLTLAPSEIPIIAEFGIAASFGMAMNLVLTVLAVPLVARIMPAPKGFERAPSALDQRIKTWLATLVLDHRRWIIVGSAAFLALSAAFASRVVVDNDFLSFFDEKSEIRAMLHRQSQDVSGASILLVEVDTHRVGGLEDPDALRDIARLTDFLGGRHDDVLSYDLFIRKTHMEVNGGDPAFFATPDTRALTAQYTLLIGPETLSRFADFDMSRALLLVRTRLSGSDAMTRELSVLEDYVAREVSPALSVRFSGSQVLVARSADLLSRSIITNLAYVFVTIFVLLSLLFSSLRAGLLSLVPNVLPIAGVFGAMGLLGIPLDTSVFPVAVIALGIAVDDTIHFMARYAAELRVRDTNEDAIRRTIELEFRPVVSSSASLAVGFAVLTFANFGSIQQFGQLAAIAMVLAVFADLIVTPALLVTTPIVSTWDLLRLRLPAQFENSSAMLHGLSAREVRRVAVSAITRSFAPGDVLLRQGDDGRDMLLILSGATRVAATEEDGSLRQVGAAGAGAIVGEMGFLSGQPRTVNVIASEPVEALQISAGTLDRLRSRNPRIANKILHNIAVVLTERLNTAQTAPRGAPPDA